MTRLEVRQAIQSFLEEARIPHVGVVYPARPEVLSEQDYEANRFGEAVETAGGSSAVLVVDITTDLRQRRADTGRTAVNDSVIHNAVIEVFFASSSGEGVRAQEDYDTVVQGIMDTIRSDATLRAPGTIWSAGEYETGVQHEQAAPFTDAEGLNILIFGAVRFEAWEWVAGNV